MRKDRNSTNPRLLQTIAIIAMILFLGVVAYAVYLTNQTVAQIEAERYEMPKEASK